MAKKFFTKSRYKKCLECPTKIFYASHPEQYENSQIDDPFLQELARGGFQVAELAKYYYEEGVEVKAQDHEEALKQTKELLKKKNVTIFEAALSIENLFVRIDILVKKGKICKLIEVKSKSIDPKNTKFYGSRGGLDSKWKPYLYDVAFQTYVARQARPDFRFNPYLMLADKSVKCDVDGINQNFLLSEDADGRTKVIVDPSLNREDLGKQILCEISVGDAVVDIQENNPHTPGISFEVQIEEWADQYISGKKISSEISRNCRDCEFRSETKGKKLSGFNECWLPVIKKRNIDKPLAFDVWNLNYRKKDKLISERRFLMEDVTEEDIGLPDVSESGMSAKERQWEQVKATTEGLEEEVIDVGGLYEVLTSVEYPLHFIDFETSMVALPFHSGRRPYEQIAFQFSHHTLDEDGKITHANQFIHTEKTFPNFEFIRQLKSSLEKDNGTILRYSNHENTVLNQIHDQLSDSEEADKNELIEFIELITHKKEKRRILRKGRRDMLDMWAIVKSYYYSPLMKGSNSIKAVLPSVLKHSFKLQKKYSKPIYGTKESPSLNFKNHRWLTKNNDPYRELGELFKKWPVDKLERTLSNSTEIANGGAAMAAYALMQFTEMTDLERTELRNALLRYCELDTLAMVMIWEHWQDIISLRKSKAV